MPLIVEPGKPMILTLDTREPNPRPRKQFPPPGWCLIREGLETSDLCVARLPACLEHESPFDLAGCLGRGRESFERELKQG